MQHVLSTYHFHNLGLEGAASRDSSSKSSTYKLAITAESAGPWRHPLSIHLHIWSRHMSSNSATLSGESGVRSARLSSSLGWSALLHKWVHWWRHQNWPTAPTVIFFFFSEEFSHGSIDNWGLETAICKIAAIMSHALHVYGLLVVVKQLRVEAYTQEITLACIRRFSHSRRQLLWWLCTTDLFDQRQQCNFADLRVPVEVARRLLHKYINTPFKL